MRTVCLSIFVFGLTVSVIVPCGALFAQPTIPKAKIPADLPADLREKILKLYSSVPLERGMAIYALVAPYRRPGPQAKLAIPFLVAMLSDNVDSNLKAKYRVRIKFPVGDAAAEALFRLGSESVKPLIQALDNSNVDTRRRAAQALGRIRDHRSTKPLARSLEDPNGQVRYDAARALYSIRDPKAAKALVAALGDNRISRASVIPYGSGYDWKLKAVGTVGEMAAYALIRIGKPAVAELIDGLKSKTPRIRGRAAWVLGRIKDTSAVKPLAVLLKDSSVEVRRKAAEALVPISSRKTLDAALTALRDNDSQVRGHAATILSSHVNKQDKKLVDPLILALGDSSATVRASVSEALGKLDDPRVVKPLMQVLADDDPTVRQKGATALGKLRARPAVKLLLERLADNDKDVRRSAAYALGQIGDRRSIEPLIGLLSDKKPEVRKVAAKALAQITGQDFGQNAEKWRKWWNTQPVDPPTQ